MMDSGFKHTGTAALWRNLSFLKKKRAEYEALSVITGVPFDYHERRREILKVLSERSARRARKAA